MYSGTELCSILNHAIREDDPHAIIHAAVFAYAINMCILQKRDPEPWVQKLFPKSYPYVEMGRLERLSERALDLTCGAKGVMPFGFLSVDWAFYHCENGLFLCTYGQLSAAVI
jgi:hypothetical protein